jgi:Bacterial archaeo-eukaryotic release factor family 10
LIEIDRFLPSSRLTEPVLTAYLDTNPAQPPNQGYPPAYLIWLKSQGKEIARHAPKEETDILQEQLQRVSKHLEAQPPRHRGLVVFSGPKGFEALPLQVEVKNELQWGKPALAQLLWLLDEHRPCGVVLVNRSGMRLFRFWLGELQEQRKETFRVDRSAWRKKHLMPPSHPGVLKNRGAEHDRFEQRVAAHYQRIYRKAARELQQWVAKQKANPVLIAGPGDIAEALRSELPAELRESVLLFKKDLPRVSANELVAQVEPTLQAWERKHEMALVDGLFAAGRGRAVLGVDATLKSLQEGRALQLVVVRGIAGMVQQCIQCGAAVRLSGHFCPYCGGKRHPMPLRVVLPELARRFKVPVEVVAGEAASKLREAGGIGAKLSESRVKAQAAATKSLPGE